ncbi:hyccin-like [Oscarella lobularis]|uniref:hyccin-like n=1 Tax=Oscarella lobularis TaxID=121494 RepID=UPI00331441BA
MNAVETFLDSLDSCSPNDLKSRINAAGDVIESILTEIETNPTSQLSCRVYHLLYKIRDSGVKLFLLECFPPLLWQYLIASARMNAELKSRIEPCLIEIHNREVVEREIVPGNRTFEIPSLSKPSIYHKLPHGKSGGSQLLTESALRSHNVKASPESLRKVDKITGSNRMTVLAVILNCYRVSIGLLSVPSRQSLCHVFTRLSVSGFPQWIPIQLRFPDEVASLDQDFLKEAASCPRLTFSVQFLQEIASILYFSLYNKEGPAALQALNVFHKRVSYDGISEVLMVTNAIINSMDLPNGNPGSNCFSFKPDQLVWKSTSPGVNTTDAGIVEGTLRRTSSLPEIRVDDDTASRDFLEKEAIEMVSPSDVLASIGPEKTKEKEEENKKEKMEGGVWTKEATEYETFV